MGVFSGTLLALFPDNVLFYINIIQEKGMNFDGLIGFGAFNFSLALLSLYALRT